MEEISFDSLPFLFSDCERSIIIQYKQKAIEKEHELACRRREKVEQLRTLVQQKIANAEARKQLTCNSKTPLFRREQARDEVPLYREQAREEVPTYREQQTHPYGLQMNDKGALLHHDNTAARYIHQFHIPLAPMKKEQNVYTLVSAMAKGFLVRLLLCSEKVKEVITTIKDASVVLKSLERSGDQQDCTLQSRVRTQLQVAKMKLYNIFFVVPVAQRMMYIAHSRQLRREGKVQRQKPSSTRISSATLKTLSRRKAGLKSAGGLQLKSSGNTAEFSGVKSVAKHTSEKE